MFFRRKNLRDNELVINSVLIEKNASQINFLIKLAQGHEALEKKLKEAQIKIKYLGPTEIKSAAQLDKKIENRIGDIKIALSKAKSAGSYMYCEELADGLLLLIAERKSITA